MLANYKFYLVLILALLPLFSIGQKSDISITQINVTEGLSQSTVTDILIEKSGQLWVGTCNGLNKIENNNAIPVVGAQKNNAYYSNLFIRSLCLNHSGGLIIGTENGAYLYQNRLYKKIKIPNLQQADKLLKVYELSNYTIFATREGVIGISNNKTLQLKRLECTPFEGSHSFSVQNDQIFIISKKPQAIFSINGKTGVVSKIELFKKKGTIGLSSIQAIGNQLIVSTSNALALYNRIDKTWNIIPSNLLFPDVDQDKIVIKFAKQDYKNEFWIGLKYFGVYHFDRNLKLIHNYTGVYFNKNQRTFNLEMCNSIEFDKAGNVFIGTDGNGLIKINPTIKKFNHIIPSQISNGNLKDNFTTAIYKDEHSNIYFGTLNSGLSVYNTETKSYKLIQGKNKSGVPIAIIYAIKKYDENSLLIGSDAGLFVLNEQNALDPLSEMVFKLIDRFNDSTILLGGEKGIYSLNFNKLKKINSGPIDQISILKRIGINQFLIAEKGGDIFFMNFHPTDTSFIKIYIKDKNPDLKPSLNSAIISHNCYFIGSSFGLIKLDINKKHLKTYSALNGLPSNQIYAMLTAKQNKIWISTNKGLSLFDPIKESFHNFSQDNGLQSMEFNTNASYKTEEGEMLFGGVNGINTFFPESICFSKNTPQIVLNNIILFNNKTIDAKFWKNKVLTTSIINNNLTFDFSVIEHTMPDRNELKIMLKGIDNDYINLKNRRSIHYPYLPEGEYELWAMASNHDYRWSKPIKLLTLIIPPPFYKSLWFILLAIFLIIIILISVFYLFYLRNIRKKIRELKFLQEIENLRLRIAREIHDDIGSGLTQIAMISEQIQLENHDDIKNRFIYPKLSKLALISRELIQSMSEIIWHINPYFDSLDNFLIYIRGIGNRLTEDTDLTIKFDFPDSLPELNVNADAKRRLVLIVKESINNAIKYAECDEIYIQFKIHLSTDFELVISDNGKGIEKEKMNQFGNGLRNMEQSCKEMGLTFTICKGVENGTEMRINGLLLKITTKG